MYFVFFKPQIAKIYEKYLAIWVTGAVANLYFCLLLAVFFLVPLLTPNCDAVHVDQIHTCKNAYIQN